MEICQCCRVITLINHYFQIFCIVVPELVKKKHTLNDISLTVIPYYDDFDELQEKKTRTFDHSGEYPIDPLVMDYIMDTQEIDKKFDFKSMKFDGETSRFHFTKQFDDPKDATEFKNKLNDFLQSFAKEEVKIPKVIFHKGKEEIKNKSEADKVDFNCYRSRIFLVGEKNVVAEVKLVYEAGINLAHEAPKESADFLIEGKIKLKLKHELKTDDATEGAVSPKCILTLKICDHEVILK